jgi:hypothetical protein
MNFHKYLIISLLFITTALADSKECTNIGVDVDCTLGWIERDFFLELRVAWGLKN